ncbi:unnamed protein product, partial [Notodromas monacha]
MARVVDEATRQDIIALVKLQNGGAPVESLAKEYHDMKGVRLKFSELGFKNIFELVGAIPGLWIENGRVRAASSADTRHLELLVTSTQSKNKKHGGFHGVPCRNKPAMPVPAKPISHDYAGHQHWRSPAHRFNYPRPLDQNVGLNPGFDSKAAPFGIREKTSEAFVNRVPSLVNPNLPSPKRSEH